MKIDELIEKINLLKNPICVGIDPLIEIVPGFILKNNTKEYGKNIKAITESFFDFAKLIINTIFDIVPVVKLNIAFFESYGFEGIRVYQKIASYAKEKGLVVIGDIKRGDISSTAKAYATHIKGIDIFGKKDKIYREDFITLNPYLGIDSLEPFLGGEEGVFILVKTSNKGSSDFQDIMAVNDIGNKKKNLMLCEIVAEKISKLGERYVGKYGFSNIGAVAGATHKEAGKKLRKLMPKTFFLIPGFGVQGGRVEDLRGFFNEDGSGGIVNSSRGIIGKLKEANSNKEVMNIIRTRCKKMKEELQKLST
ncbi:MAG: orotidine-5'-phosphate decarboxylase [Clostridiales Family XIII bacterium]|jgi:orotidine-5'-phosphate decarboxylase|nr:orotidine-5'-phosphate decarboxylase [Clostridiales Family XIII bacterium]